MIELFSCFVGLMASLIYIRNNNKVTPLGAVIDSGVCRLPVESFLVLVLESKSNQNDVIDRVVLFGETFL